ncbi:MAG: YbaN family protein [Pseudomonadota bacterium]
MNGPPPPSPGKARRAAWFVVGVVSLALGAVGAALPLAPTTPFLLAAAVAFSRSSDRWHAWLVNHRVFGPPIADWRAHGAIARRAKAVGVASMAGAFALSVFLGAGRGVLIVQAAVLCGAAAFVLSRPAPPPRP